MNRLDGKIAVVTGATSGIGEACAIHFAKAGAAVALVGRNQTKGLALQQEIVSNGGRASFHCADVSSDQDIEAMAHEIQSTYGKIDILFNNAGIYPSFQPLERLERADWDEVFRVNSAGLVMVTKALFPLFPENGGVILNNASVAGIQGFASGQGYAYAASKSAVIQFTKMLAKNYGRRIRINCICPGVIETPLYMNFDADKFSARIPQGRVGTPEDVATVANFLVSDDAGYINGAAIPIDGGLTL